MSASKATDLFARYRSLQPQQRAAVAAIVGATVADAAARPVHWLYDRAKLEANIGPNDDPAFWPKSLCPFYELPTGRGSCYSEVGYVMLKSLPAADGTYDKTTFVNNIVEFFSPSSDYAASIKLRQPYVPGKEIVPVPGPWQNGAITHLLKKVAANEPIDGSPDSKDSDGTCAALPLIATLSSKTNLDDAVFSETVADSAKLICSSPFVLKHTLAKANILKNVIRQGAAALTVDALVAVLGSDDELKSEWDVVKQSFDSNENFIEAAEKYGKACPYPGTLQAALLAILKSTAGEDRRLSFADAVRQLIRVGGDNCSRSYFAGAVLGAAYGFEEAPTTDASFGIPTEWLLKTNNGLEVFELALNKV